MPRLPAWSPLALTSLLWAFSFGLIRRELVDVPAPFVAAVRLALAWLVFVPFWRRRALREHALLAAIGAVQYGVMYVLYIRAYGFLEGHEVALLTALTPVHVVLLSLVLRRARVGAGRALLAAGLAAAGAAVLAWPDGSASLGSWTGAALVQAANLCFAAGQVVYAERFEGRSTRDQARVFADLYLGGALVAIAVAALTIDALPVPTSRQAATLVYLGVVPSGLGFFLWNVGAARVSAAALAVWNNVKVPLAVVVALVVFGEPARPGHLAAGAALIALGLVVARRPR